MATVVDKSSYNENRKSMVTVLISLFAFFVLYYVILVIFNISAIRSKAVGIMIYELIAYDFTKAVIILIAILVIGLLIYLLSSQGKRLEHVDKQRVKGGVLGDASFQTERELKEQYQVIKYPSKIEDISKDYKSGWLINIDSSKKEALVDIRDRHNITIAPPGTGKTSELLIPEIIFQAMCGDSFFIADPKGDLLKNLKPILESLGYDIRVYNFKETAYSKTYNLIGSVTKAIDEYEVKNRMYEETKNDLYKFEAMESLARAQTKALEIADKIITAVAGGDTSSSSGAFFTNSSKGGLAAAILLVAQYSEHSKRHFPSVLSFINDISLQSDETTSKLKEILVELMKVKDHDIAVSVASSFKSAIGETLLNILSSLEAYLLSFQNEAFNQVLNDTSSNDYQGIVDRKTAVFVVIPENNPIADTLVGLVMTQHYESLIEIADTGDGALPRVVRFQVEEFSNIPKINKMHNYLGISRSRRIYFSLYVQDMHQLEEKYGEKITKSMLSICKLHRILGVGSEDITTAEMVSKALGSMTVKTKNVNYDPNAVGLSGHTTKSMTESMHERSLLKVEEVISLGHPLMINAPFKPAVTNLVGFYEDSFPYKIVSSGYKGELRKWVELERTKAEEILHTVNPALEIETFVAEAIEQKIIILLYQNGLSSIKEDFPQFPYTDDDLGAFEELLLKTAGKLKIASDIVLEIQELMLLLSKLLKDSTENSKSGKKELSPKR